VCRLSPLLSDGNEEEGKEAWGDLWLVLYSLVLFRSRNGSSAPMSDRWAAAVMYAARSMQSIGMHPLIQFLEAPVSGVAARAILMPLLWLALSFGELEA
jgi:hypothetical protein